MNNLNKLFLSVLSASVLAACTTDYNQVPRYSTVSSSSTVSQRIADHQKDGYVYGQHGMEVSAVTSAMSNTLYDTMYANLFHSAPEITDAEGNTVKNVVFPKVAIASFYDTDTYQDAGTLGRELSEFFVHELNKRGVGVFEYKLTGKIAVTKEGEYIMSRDYTKLGRKAMVSHILSGSITRNDDGVVLVARIVNIQDQTVLGSATGFIPYSQIPYCYRTDIKNCSIRSKLAYITNVQNTPGSGRWSNYGGVRVHTTGSANGATGKKEQEPLKTYKQKDAAGMAKGANGKTSEGNFDQYIDEVNTKNFFEKTFGRCTFANCDSPVIYRAASSNKPKTQLIVRDIEEQSQYERLKHK